MCPLTVAVGGDHYDVGAEESLTFCPLRQLEDDGDKAWAAGWLETLVEPQGVRPD
jgi:type IV secretion system protein TrbE